MLGLALVGLMAGTLAAQSTTVTIPGGNNLYQVTNPTTGLSYAINRISDTNVQLLTINPSGTYTVQQITLPVGYRLALGRAAHIALAADGKFFLNLVSNSGGGFKVAEYNNFNVAAPVVLSAPAAQVFGIAESGRVFGNVAGQAGEILSSGGYLAAPGQVTGTAFTAWEGSSGVGYAGFLASSTTGRTESFTLENGVVSDPFASLNYESAYVGACSRFGSFCFGDVTDAVNGEQMFGIDRNTGNLTAFLDQSGNRFSANFFAGAREDGWVFGNFAGGLFAANPFIWGTEVRSFNSYCLGFLVGVSCSAFQDLNSVTE